MEDGQGVGSVESDHLYPGYGTECATLGPTQKDFGATKFGNRKLDYMKRGIAMGIVKDILLVFVGSMLGVTVMCLMNASAAADRAMEKKGK